MPVRLLDAKAGTWSTLECTAEEGDDLPRPRGGHSVRGRAMPSHCQAPQASTLGSGARLQARPGGDLFCRRLSSMHGF